MPRLHVPSDGRKMLGSQTSYTVAHSAIGIPLQGRPGIVLNDTPTSRKKQPGLAARVLGLSGLNEGYVGLQLVDGNSDLGRGTVASKGLLMVWAVEREPVAGLVAVSDLAVFHFVGISSRPLSGAGKKKFERSG